MAGETIRDIVERCYSTPSGILAANPLDQLNPSVPTSGSSGNVVPPVNPGDAIRNIVGRCYSVPVYNLPNVLDEQNPIPVQIPPTVPPDPKPGDVIRRIVERCYSTPPELPQIIDPPTPPDIGWGWELPPWGPWMHREFGWLPPIKITLHPPYKGGSAIIVKTGPEDQCDKVRKLLELNLLRALKDYSEPGFPSPGWWEHIETGEKYYCDLDQGLPGDPFKTCVRNALDCLFRPYLGGQWEPPKANCDAYWPNGWSGNQTEVCVENCYPDRIPIYESTMSTGTLAFSFDGSGNLVATGSGTAVAVLKLQWNDNPNTYNVAINNIQMGGQQWTRTGRSGEEIHTLNITGAGTTSITMNGNSGGFTIVDNNTRICMKDLDGNDCNANFSIVSINTGSDHAYDPNGAKSGYTLTNSKPAFYILAQPIENVTVPLFRFYSTTQQDTFLTTNPGQPDTAGAGERATMNASGMAGGEVLGHVFPTASAMRSYLHDDEQAEALNRFWSTSPFDHKYTIDGEIVGGNPQKIPKRWCYRIPIESKADLNISMDVEKGGAGYDNALGFYLADATGPKYGRIVVTSARNGTNLFNAWMTSLKLNEYAGGTMGFFLIPNGGGQNSLSIMQEVTFSPLNSPYSGGFSAVGINTAQNNYCLFSDKTWNPMQKDQTKWQGKNNQFWEDLIAGDDDYDDLRLWHRLGWTYGGYTYEGIQCYLYEGAAPEKVMRKIDPTTKCDARILKASFKDVIMRRMDCGNKVPAVFGNDVEWECGTCNGEYSVKLNTNQSIKAAVGGTFRFVSMGGINGGLFGACMKFTVEMRKKDKDDVVTTLFNKQFEAQYWPAIGRDLYDQDIILEPTDELTFEVVSIDTGAVTGDISLEAALYALDTTMFEGAFKIMLGTQSHDSVIAAQTGNPTLNPITKEGGLIEGFPFSYNPTNRLEFEWEAGSKLSETWSEDNVPDPGDPYTYVWANNIPVAMHGSLQANPEIPGQSRIIGSTAMPTLPGAYIDTGYLYDVESNYFSATVLESYNYRNLSGVYNHLVEDYLFTRFETLSGTNISQGYRDILSEAAPTTFARGSKPWYTIGANSVGSHYLTVVNNIWDGAAQAPQRDTYFSPITFIQDYTLDNYHGTGGGNYADAAKIRVGITFYPVIFDQTTSSKQVHYWQAMIHVIDVIDQGKGYTKGSEFVLTWPPMRDRASEDPSQTPYYPDQEAGFSFPLGKQLAWWENEDLVRRSLKEAFYQESHNKDSVVWYSGTDKAKFRVRFKVTLTQCTDPP